MEAESQPLPSDCKDLPPWGTSMLEANCSGPLLASAYEVISTCTHSVAVAKHLQRLITEPPASPQRHTHPASCQNKANMIN